MRALALLALLALAGCAAQKPAVLHLGMLDAPEGKQIYFPPAPEVPRYLYAGELTGERNFRREGDSGRGFLRRLFEAITGLDSADAPSVELQRPVTGMVDDKGRIFVTDMSRQAVLVFDPVAGELKVWEKAHGLSGFAAPAGIAAGRDGEVLVADAELAMVVRLDAAGEPKGNFGKGLLRRPTGLARDARRGRVYVADTYGHDIKVFDDAGALLRTLGRRGEAPGEFNFPTHLALARDELYVTDTMNSRVQVFDAESGAFKRQFGGPGLYLGNFVRPKGVGVDGEGNVYVVEGYYDRLLVFGERGEFLMPIGGTGMSTGRFYLPNGVWVDARNRVFVADMFNGRVVVFQFLGGN
jgi:DNA-binding beta-propeller fold protein YncE